MTVLITDEINNIFSVYSACLHKLVKDFCVIVIQAEKDSNWNADLCEYKLRLIIHTTMCHTDYIFHYLEQCFQYPSQNWNTVLDNSI